MFHFLIEFNSLGHVFWSGIWVLGVKEMQRKCIIQSLRLLLPRAEEPEAYTTVYLTIPAESHDNYFLIA